MTLHNLYFEGAAGSQKIRNIIDSYRTNPPKEIAGAKVVKLIDFGRDDIEDADAKPIPKEDFYFVELDNGYRYAVRGSGTEPKIKFYCFAREDVDSDESLEAVKAATMEKVEAMSKPTPASTPGSRTVSKWL